MLTGQAIYVYIYASKNFNLCYRIALLLLLRWTGTKLFFIIYGLRIYKYTKRDFMKQNSSTVHRQFLYTYLCPFLGRLRATRQDLGTAGVQVMPSPVIHLHVRLWLAVAVGTFICSGIVSQGYCSASA